MVATNNPQLKALKTFLKGRIAQEQGNSKEALVAFDQALALDPDNRFVHSAKAFALREVDKSSEALVSRIKGSYGEMARKNSGANDKPGPWIEDLTSLLNEVESFEETDRFAVAW